MADIVQFLVTMQDVATGPLQKIAQTGEQAFAGIQQAVQKLSGKMEAMKDSLKQINDQLNGLLQTRAISIDDTQIKKMSSDVDQLLKKKEKLEKDGSGGGLPDNIADAFFDAAKLAVKTGITNQTNLMAMQLRLGNSAGASVNSGLEEMAKTGVYGDGVFKAGQQLADAGVKAEKIVPVIHMAGDIGLGNSDKMQPIARAYGGASRYGYLTQGQASMMNDAGFDPIKALHESTGKSLPQLESDLAQGKISIDDLTRSMVYATGTAGQYYDAMKKIEESPVGQLNELDASITSIGGSIGQLVLPALGAMADVLNTLLSCTPLVYALATAWGIFAIAVKIAGIWDTILDIAMAWPIVLIAVVIGLITYLIRKYDGWGKAIKALWSVIKSFADLAMVSFKELFQELIYGFESVWLKAKSSFEHIVVFVTNVMKAVNLALHGDFAEAKNVLTARITTEADYQSNALNKKRNEERAANKKRIATDIVNAGKQLNDVRLQAHKGSAYSNPLDKVMPSLPGNAGAGREEVGVSTARENPPSGDTAGTISGGGARHITINVAKFQDKTEIHTVGLKEGIKEVEDIIRDMFLRITHSASTMTS